MGFMSARFAAAAAAAGMAAAVTLRGDPQSAQLTEWEEEQEWAGSDADGGVYVSTVDQATSGTSTACHLPLTAKYIGVSKLRPSCKTAARRPRPSVAPPRTPPRSPRENQERSSSEQWPSSVAGSSSGQRPSSVAPPPKRPCALPQMPPVSPCEDGDEDHVQPHPPAHPPCWVRASKVNQPIGARSGRQGCKAGPVWQSSGCRLCRECGLYTYIRKGACANEECPLARW